MRILLVSGAILLSAAATGAYADPVAPGGTVTYTVPGTSSIYQIFGHPGDPGGENSGSSTNAIETTFTSGSGNTFNITASGLINCCSGTPDTPPDGGTTSMNVTGTNGLSSLIGNSNIPLVGVFTTDTDPFGGTAPATLTFDANNPTNLSPLLNQVFYIGDGRTGYNNNSGALLNFTAPSTATRLYLGTIDAYGFNGLTGYYADNPGSFSVSATILGSAVPEPATWITMILGFGVIGFGLRRSRASAERKIIAV